MAVARHADAAHRLRPAPACSPGSVTAGPSGFQSTSTGVATPSTSTVSFWRRGGAELEGILRAPRRIAAAAVGALHLDVVVRVPEHVHDAEGDGARIDGSRRQRVELAADQAGVHLARS